MATLPQTANPFNLEQLQAAIGGRIVNAGQTLTNVSCIAPDHPGDRDSRSAWWNIHNGHIYGHCRTHHCHWQFQDQAAHDLLGLPPKEYSQHSQQSYAAAHYTSPDGRNQVDEMRFDWNPSDPPCWYTIDYRTPLQRPCDNRHSHKHVWHSPAGVNTAGWPALIWLPELHRTQVEPAEAQIAATIDQEQWIVVAEGSKAARAIAAAGITSTSVLGGIDAFRRFNFDCITERPVAIWPDHDVEWRQYTANTAQAIAPYAPSRIVIITPNGEPGSKDDAADLPAEARIHAIQNAITNPASIIEPHTDPTAARTLPQDRPSVLANGDIEYKEQVDTAWNAIVAGNHRPASNDYALYRRDQHLITTKLDDEDRLTIYPIEEPHMRDILSRHLFWYSDSRDTGIRARQPNFNVVRDLPKAPHDDIPRLRRISVTPFISATTDELHINNGYYHEERILMDCPVAIDMMDLEKAVDAFDDLIDGFPFETKADRANCFAAAIMPILSVRMPVTPLALFGKPVPRTGATLLAEVIGMVANGFLPTKMQLSKDTDETAKELAAGLQNNSGILLWDNLAGEIDNPIWAQYLTGASFGKRKLRHDDLHYQLSRAGVVDFATANNLSLSAELVKRSFSIRLNARMAEPDTRANFKHPNLIQYAREQRPYLLSALCSIVQAWINAGMPVHNGPNVMGGFESWRIMTASILHYAGIEGFLGNTALFADHTQERDDQWITFLKLWWDTYQDTPVTTSTLFDICENANQPQILPLKGQSAAGRTKSLANRISEAQDVVRRLPDDSEVTISRMPKARNYTYWQLTRITYPDELTH